MHNGHQGMVFFVEEGWTRGLCEPNGPNDSTHETPTTPTFPNTHTHTTKGK